MEKYSAHKTVSETSKSQHNHKVFPVAVVENVSADRCKLSGLYEVRVGSLSLTLHNIAKKQTVYTWPYKHIRRYGRSSNNFQFEAGRKCQSGEGLFSLITEEGAGELLFAQISKRFDEIRQKKSSSGCSSSGGSSTESDTEAPVYEEAPALPPRNYKSDTLQSLFTKRAAKAKKVPKLKVPRAMKEAGMSRSKSTQESHYDEIDLYKEESAVKSASPTVSASVLNSLIKRHKDALTESPKKQKQKLMMNNNNMESPEQEGVYHELHDVRKRPPSEDIYSEVK